MMTPINKRRLQNFKANKRGYWSLWIFLAIFVLSMFSEFIANDKPIVFTKDGEIFFPVFITYTEKDLGGVLDSSQYSFAVFGGGFLGYLYGMF